MTWRIVSTALAVIMALALTGYASAQSSEDRAIFVGHCLAAVTSQGWGPDAVDPTTGMDKYEFCDWLDAERFVIGLGTDGVPFCSQLLARKQLRSLRADLARREQSPGPLDAAAHAAWGVIIATADQCKRMGFLDDL